MYFEHNIINKVHQESMVGNDIVVIRLFMHVELGCSHAFFLLWKMWPHISCSSKLISLVVQSFSIRVQAAMLSALIIMK